MEEEDIKKDKKIVRKKAQKKEKSIKIIDKCLEKTGKKNDILQENILSKKELKKYEKENSMLEDRLDGKFLWYVHDSFAKIKAVKERNKIDFKFSEEELKIFEEKMVSNMLKESLKINFQKRLGNKQNWIYHLKKNKKKQ